MKKLFGHLYDQTGACPECGKPLRPVRYFTGVEDHRTNLGTQQIRHGSKLYNQTTYNVNYTNIQEHRAGFCDACDQAEWDAKEANWPKPGRGPVIGAIVGCVALAVGVALLVLSPWRELEGLASKNMSGVLVLLMGGGLFALIGCLASYIPKRKEYAQHMAGYRAPYVPKAEAELSNWAKNRSKPIPSDGRVYWSLTEFETMQKINSMLNGSYFK